MNPPCVLLYDELRNKAQEREVSLNLFINEFEKFKTQNL